MLSYRGISDRVAADYLERHGQATWQAIEHDLQRGPSCPKLKSYWHFHGCRYSKRHYTCAEPEHLPQCPPPKYWLRNGGLNQTAFCLYLFIRDVADGDLAGWIDRHLQAASKPAGLGRLAAMRMAVLAPLKEVYGVSDKVLMVALSSLFLGAPLRRTWAEVGASMIAVDSLVFCIAPAFCSGSMPAMPMARPATGPAAAPRSSKRSRSTSMRENSTVPIRRPFHALCGGRSGSTARRTASTSATAIASMIENAVAIQSVNCIVYAIETHCIVKVLSKEIVVYIL